MSRIPSLDQFGPVVPTPPDDAHAVTACVMSRFGDDESRDVLEALELAGYMGHDLQQGHWQPRWREGAVA